MDSALLVVYLFVDNHNLILMWSFISVLFLADISHWDGYSVVWGHKDFVKRGEVISKVLKKTLFTQQDKEI